MHPTIQTLHDIIAGRTIKGASDELHMAFMHHGDFETSSWSGIFDAQTAADLLPYAEAALAKPGDTLAQDVALALLEMVTFGANDDERVSFLLVDLGCAFWDEGGVVAIDSEAEKRWEAVFDAMEGA
jgi:hypothetical protein